MNRCFLLLLVAVIAVSSCKKEENQDEIDEQLIQQYIADNNITNAERTEFGVYYIIDEPGDSSGVYPNITSTVRVHYRGYFLDGNEFDPGNFDDTPINFILSSVIAGWQIGMPYFEKGSKGRLLIPSAYGYGRAGTPNVPPNSVLVFDVDLVNIY